MFSAILPTDSLEANVFARNSAKLEVYHRQPKQQLSEIIRVCMGIFTTALIVVLITDHQRYISENILQGRPGFLGIRYSGAF